MTDARFRAPAAIVSCDWLAAHLNDPELRVYDCTTYLEFTPDEPRPYRVISGRATFEEGHIPGARPLDLQGDFSATDSPFAMTLPSVKDALRAFEQSGVADGVRVVLYSKTVLPWATRFWWMLRWLGFDNATILDGGFQEWEAKGHPISKGPSEASYPAGHLTPNPRPEVFVGRKEVLLGIQDDDTCSIMALSPDIYSGENTRYGRPGRIPGSVNVPITEVVAPDSQKLRSPDEIARVFSQAGAGSAQRHITYCGGGIFATLDAFLLHQLGHDDVAVYDNSMSEWAADPDLPLETG